MPRLTPSTLIALLAAGLLPASLPAHNLIPSLDQNSVTLSLPDGRIVWRAQVNGSAPNSIAPLAGGRWQLDNGDVLDRQGRLVSTAILPSAAANPAAAPPVWGPTGLLFPLVDQEQNIQYGSAGPAFDGQGNAYVANSEVGGSNSVQVVKSNGAGGTWGAPQTIYHFGPQDLGGCGNIIADRFGNVTLLCRNLPATGGYQYLALRYSVTAGWLPPTILYQGNQFFQILNAVGDAQGDIIAVIDLADSANHTAATSFVYSAAAQQWLPPTGIAPLSAHSDAENFTLQVNHTGNAIFFAYYDQLGLSSGIYAQRFDIGTLTWSAAQLVPGSNGILSNVPVSNAGLPLAVDGSGTATLVFNLINGNNYHADVRASRYQNGRWQPAVKLLEASNVALELSDFASADANATEVAVAAQGVMQSGPGVLYVFRYDGSRWSTELAAQFATSGLRQVTFAFTGSANASVAQFAPDFATVAVYSDGNTWSAQSPVPYAYSTETGTLGTNSLGQTVLLYPGTVDPSGYLDAAWLQN
jgi:hypothetical protein